METNEKKSTIRERVYNYILEREDGVTNGEIREALKMPHHNMVYSATKALVGMGSIKKLNFSKHPFEPPQVHYFPDSVDLNTVQVQQPEDELKAKMESNLAFLVQETGKPREEILLEAVEEKLNSYLKEKMASE